MEPILATAKNPSDPFLTSVEKFLIISGGIRENLPPPTIPCILELFNLIPELETVPKKIRHSVVGLMAGKCVEPGQVILPADLPEVNDFFILVDGRVQAIPAGKSFDSKRLVKRWEQVTNSPKKLQAAAKETLGTGTLFGQLYGLTQEKWKPTSIVALEQSTILVVNHEQTAKLIKEASSKVEFVELFNFLASIFPFFGNLSNMQQRKMVDTFKPVEFLSGQHLIAEGEVGSLAYLIKEGECMITSAKNPLSVGQPLAVSHKKSHCPVVDTLFKTKRGFLSNTTNKFQFGILQQNQWVGAERLIKKYEEPFDYSATALGKVKAFVVSKGEAARFPREFHEYIVKIVDGHYQWIEKRAKILIESSVHLASLDPSAERYDEELAEVKKRFPAASLYAITAIRKKQVLKKASTKKAGGDESPASRNDLSLPHIFPQTVKAAGAEIAAQKIPSKYRSFITGVLSPQPPKASHAKNPSSISALENSPTIPATKKHKMTTATSAAKLTLINTLTPMLGFGATIGSGKFRGNALNQSNGSVLREAGEKVVPRKELNQFRIGPKTIQVVEKGGNERPITPNPFSMLNWYTQTNVETKQI